MATISARRTAGADTRSAGGKMVRNRRLPAASRTPYARPSTPATEDEQTEAQNPNWLSGLIYPAKVIASGAGKIFSFFGNDYSSSSSDDSENDYDDEEEVENDGSDKVLSPSSKSDNKRKIEQLVMEETFSREEGNELIRLIKSRIVDFGGTFGESTPRARTTAIMEARKWLLEKRSGSKKKLENELDVTPSQFTRSEKGSPVDMAKSYMQSRPAWASPSLKQSEVGSPSTFGMLNFKEATPNSTLRSSELKRSSFTSGSWNLLEEIRRVRSKATEELLAATPLTKTSLSSFYPENNQSESFLMSKDVVGAGLVGSAHDRVENVVTDAAANPASRAGEDGDAVQSLEHQEHLEVTDLKSNKDDEVSEFRSAAAGNGFVGSASGLVQGLAAAHESRPSEGENGNLVGSGEGGHDAHLEDTLNPYQEPADVPSSNPTDAVVNGSQNSSSMQQEDLSQELSQPALDSSPAKAKDTQKERKSRGYTRRGRGRGK